MLLAARARGRGLSARSCRTVPNVSGVLSRATTRASARAVPARARDATLGRSATRRLGGAREHHFGQADRRAGDPVDRRAARARRRPAADVGAAREDQQLLGARHRDVEQAALLLGVGRGVGVGELGPGGRRDRVAAAERGEPQPGGAVVADEQRRARPARLAAEVGDADDRELEALGAVDRHQPHGVQALGLERRLALARLGEVAGLGVGEEAAQVAALGAFVLARQAHQLAQVREAAVAAGARERGEVVAGGDDRALEQHLQRRSLGVLALGGQQPRDRGVRRLHRLPQAAARVAVLGQADELVGAGAVEGRGEHRQQRLLVVRVGEHAQPGEAVADLLLAPVAAAADDVRRQALLLERLLEQPQARRRADEHDHVAGAAAVVELGRSRSAIRRASARRHGWSPPLRQPEPRRQLVPALRAGDEQLDGRRPRGGPTSNSRSAPCLSIASLLAARPAAARSARRARARTRR